MHPSIILAAASLVALAAAVPTPTDGQPLACTTLTPTIIQPFLSWQPNSGGGLNQPNIIVSHQPPLGDIVSYIGFTGIPAGAWGCSLQFTLTSSSSSSNPNGASMNISRADVGRSDQVAVLSSRTFESLFSEDVDPGLFDTVGPLTFEGTTPVTTPVNQETCPTDLADGGGNLAFVFEIADFSDGEEQNILILQSETDGVFLTYNCD